MLSIFIPGAGQFNNGEAGKGIVQLAGAVGGLTVAVADLPTETSLGLATVKTGNAGLSAAGFGVAFVASVWSIVDAPTSSRRIKRQLNLTSVRNGEDLGFAYRWTF